MLASLKAKWWIICCLFSLGVKVSAEGARKARGRVWGQLGRLRKNIKMWGIPNKRFRGGPSLPPLPYPLQQTDPKCAAFFPRPSERAAASSDSAKRFWHNLCQCLWVVATPPNPPLFLLAQWLSWVVSAAWMIFKRGKKSQKMRQTFCWHEFTWVLPRSVRSPLSLYLSLSRSYSHSFISLLLPSPIFCRWYFCSKWAPLFYFPSNSAFIGELPAPTSPLPTSAHSKTS